MATTTQAKAREQLKIRQQLKSSILKLADNPAKIKELVDAGKAKRKTELSRLGVPAVSQKAVAAEITRILTTPGTSGGGDVQRPVEWVGAIATLVAGALAA